MLSYLKVLSREAGVNLALLEGETLERSVGWVFFYQSEDFLKSGDFSDRLAGNAPVLVDRSDGSLHETGTAHPIEVYLQNYEKHGDPHHRL